VKARPFDRGRDFAAGWDWSPDNTAGNGQLYWDGSPKRGRQVFARDVRSGGQVHPDAAPPGGRLASVDMCLFTRASEAEM